MIKSFNRDDNASCERAKKIKSFYSGKAYKINDMTSKLSESKSNWRFMVEIKKVDEKAISTKEDLLTTIWENWNHLNVALNSGNPYLFQVWISRI